MGKTMMLKHNKWLLRFLILALVLGLQLLYLPLNRGLSGGVEPVIPFDAQIPLQPAWVFIYLAALPGWFGALLWATLKMDDRLYRISILTALFAIFVGVITYITYPSYVLRPEVPGQGLAADLLRWVYANDRPYNALPSSHVYLTVIIALLWSRWKPKFRWVWLVLALAVCLSTLFTKQHYVLDVLSGTLLALLAYSLAVWVERKRGEKLKR